MRTDGEVRRYVQHRADELLHVLTDAVKRYHAMAPDVPLDYTAESLSIEATFEQGWGSTAGGFGGIGGQMMTGSQTWVIRASGHRELLIYFGARLAHATDDYEWAGQCIQKRRFPPSRMPNVRPGDPLPIRRTGGQEREEVRDGVD